MRRKQENKINVKNKKMRRIMFVLMLLVGITAGASGQERIKKVLELKNGTTITGYVMEQDNGNYMLETEAGDVLFFSREDVAAVRSLNQSVSLSVLEVQQKRPADLLKRAGFGLEFINSKEPLRPEQVSKDFWQEYAHASKKKKSGMILMIAGGSSLVVGSLLFSFAGQSYYWWSDGRGNTESYYYINGAGYAGIGLMGAGLGVAVWGVIRFMSGNSQLGRLATQFNSGNGYISELSLDYSPTGIALVYKF
jgi:hypothetical protein